MLTSKEIEVSLKRLGFVQHVDHKRINGFRRNDIDHPLYVKTPSGNDKAQSVFKQPLVLHSKYEAKKEELEKSLSGVLIDWDQYVHNSNLKGFPKRVNKGKTEIHFGLAVGIADEKALKDLVVWLSGKQVEAKPQFSESERIENVEPELNAKIWDNQNIDNVENVIDEFSNRAIKTRRGQPAFRKALLAVFDGKCCITGCSIESVLEAAHIMPHSEETNYQVTNGILLRADLHTLYDLNLVGIDEQGQVHLAASLSASEYEKYKGVLISDAIPPQTSKNLKKRFEDFFIRKNIVML